MTEEGLFETAGTMSAPHPEAIEVDPTDPQAVIRGLLMKGGTAAAAVDYAAAHPGQVKSIVISSTQCYSQDPMTEVNRRVFPKEFHMLEPEWQAKLKDWHGADYAEAFYTQFIRFGGEYGTGVFDLRPVLPSVACPFLILYPDRSSIFNVEQGVMFYRHLPAGYLHFYIFCF